MLSVPSMRQPHALIDQQSPTLLHAPSPAPSSPSLRSPRYRSPARRAMAAGASIAAVSAVAAMLRREDDLHSVRRAVVATLGGALLSLAGVAFVGATTPRVTWFGSLVSHGPRNSSMVAITFDDGPDPP